MDRNNTLKSITIGIMLVLSIVAICTGIVSAKPIEMRAMHIPKKSARLRKARNPLETPSRHQSRLWSQTALQPPRQSVWQIPVATPTLPKTRPPRIRRIPVPQRTILHGRLELMPRIRNLFRVSGFCLLSLDFLRLPILDG